MSSSRPIWPNLWKTQTPLSDSPLSPGPTPQISIFSGRTALDNGHLSHVHWDACLVSGDWVVSAPLDVSGRDRRFGSKVGQIGPKWDKSVPLWSQTYDPCSNRSSATGKPCCLDEKFPRGACSRLTLLTECSEIEIGEGERYRTAS